MAPDSIRGWRLPANTVLLWRGGPAHINSLGLRGAEPDPDVALRVLFVGDSSVFGDGVGEEETMVAQARR